MSRCRNTLTVLVAVCLLACWAYPAQARHHVLAIFNLRPTNFEAMGYNGDILYALISALENKKTVEIMPRREMEEILYHAGMVQGDDPQLVNTAGKLLGVHYILFGQVTKRGEDIQVQLNLMNIETGRIVRGWSLSFAGREAIIKEIPLMISGLCDALQNKAQEAVAAAGPAASRPPSADIVNLQLKNEGNAVVLSWQTEPPGPVDGFHVYRAESAGGPFQLLGKTDQAAYTDKGVKRGHSYFYQIGIVSGGEVIKSRRVAQAKDVGERIPHPPLILGAGGHIKRAWLKFVPSLVNDQDNFKIQRYRVYRRDDATNDWRDIASLDAELTSQSELAFFFEDAKALEDGRTYTYAVSSVDSSGRESGFSDSVSVVTRPRPRLTLEKDRLLRKVRLAWEPMKNVDGYYLYRKTGESPWAKVASIRDENVYRYEDDKELADEYHYEYYLTAYDAKGETNPSNQVAAETKAFPAPPQDVLAQTGLVKAVRITWTPLDDPDVGGYAVYRGTRQDELKKIEKVSPNTSGSFLDEGSTFWALEDGQTYYYALKSYNLFGAEGRATRPVVARTKPRPAAVRGLKAVAGDKRIEIIWRRNPEPDIGGYLLSRLQNQGFWSTVKEIGSAETRYVDTDLKVASTYRYKIIAIDKDGLKSDPVESDPVLSPLVKTGK